MTKRIWKGNRIGNGNGNEIWETTHWYEYHILEERNVLDVFIEIYVHICWENIFWSLLGLRFCNRAGLNNYYVCTCGGSQGHNRRNCIYS